jgi:tetratricopeptide (TPR) repeat protein
LSGEAQSLDNIGSFHMVTGKHEDAIRFYHQALNYFRQLNDNTRISSTLLNIGSVYKNQGNFVKALERYQESLHNLSAEENHTHAWILSNIGHAYAKIGDFPKALLHSQRAIEIKIKLKQVVSGFMWCILAEIFLLTEEYDQAEKLLDSASKVFSDFPNNMGEIRTLSLKGELFIKTGKPLLAEKTFSQALIISREGGYKAQTAELLKQIGFFNLRNQKLALAYSQLGESLKLAKEINNKELQKENYHCLYEYYMLLGQREKAREYYGYYLNAAARVQREINQVIATEIEIKEKLNSQLQQMELIRKDNRIKELELKNQRFIRNTLIISLIVIIAGLFVLIKKYLFLFMFWQDKQKIGSYRIIEKLGSGAIGTVFKGRSMVDSNQLPVAIKLLKEELASQEIQKIRFKQEAAIIDSLDHPHIIRIIERGHIKDNLYLVMEFLEGTTLESVIAGQGTIPVSLIIHIGLQIADTLHYIHKKNVIHRDLKPANIMLINHENDPYFIKLLDFGLARLEFNTRLTQSGNFVGTIEYVAPESILKGNYSPASDIFAFGVCLYRMAAGISPFPGTTIVDIIQEVIKAQPEPLSTIKPQLPGQLSSLILEMIHHDPVKRPAAEIVGKRLLKIKDEISSNQAVNSDYADTKTS